MGTDPFKNLKQSSVLWKALTLLENVTGILALRFRIKRRQNLNQTELRYG